ncbi:hypothetical protein NECAME_09852 [Necator americanus]|uniref:Uncharacterized protein n=1 Tax=Necator americanus TaxID=51031 RepID=W2TC36_NECAM|nr:hypothetical protein NECAME_09852 [Necator americanus]ETN79388.1 hypothetical protein NECAME_09852 [Necator americanus]
MSLIAVSHTIPRDETATESCKVSFVHGKTNQKEILNHKMIRGAIATEAFEKSRGIGVETEKTVVKDTGVGCKNVHLDNGAFYRVRPAVAVEDQEPITRTTEVFAKEQRRVCVTPEEDSFRTAFNGVRERARSTEADAISAANFHDNAVSTDSSSYRNYAYQRDIGGVAPVEGFDRVETRERRYCLSDDENYELVEKDVKRTHTSRFLQESRQINDDDHSSVGERYREEDVHHAVYSQNVLQIFTVRSHGPCRCPTPFALHGLENLPSKEETSKD